MDDLNTEELLIITEFVSPRYALNLKATNKHFT